MNTSDATETYVIWKWSPGYWMLIPRKFSEACEKVETPSIDALIDSVNVSDTPMSTSDLSNEKGNFIQIETLIQDHHFGGWIDSPCLPNTNESKHIPLPIIDISWLNWKASTLQLWSKWLKVMCRITETKAFNECNNSSTVNIRSQHNSIHLMNELSRRALPSHQLPSVQTTVSLEIKQVADAIFVFLYSLSDAEFVESINMFVKVGWGCMMDILALRASQLIALPEDEARRRLEIPVEYQNAVLETTKQLVQDFISNTCPATSS